MTRTQPLALLLVGLGVAACGDASGDADAMRAVTRDSAGVTIVENPVPPDSGGVLALAPEPDLLIGVLDGAPEYQLFEVGDVVRLSDSTIVVANTGTHELRFYSPDGRFLRASGREGAGPGEFARLSQVDVLPGDSLLVYDQGNRRLSLFDPEGTFVRAVPLEGSVRFPFPAGLLDPDRVVFTSNAGFERMNEAPPGIIQVPQRVYVVSWRDGLVVDEPTFNVPANRLFLSRGEDFMAVRPLLLTGRSDIEVRHGRIYYSPADGYEIRQIAGDGSASSILRSAYESVPLTSDIWDATVARILENVEDEAWRIRQERSYADMPRPSHLPVHGSVVVDDARRVWVERIDADFAEGSPARWDVFDDNGQWVGVVTLPPRFRIEHIGADWMLGVVTDEYDVEQVRLYRLVS